MLTLSIYHGDHHDSATVVADDYNILPAGRIDYVATPCGVYTQHE